MERINMIVAMDILLCYAWKVITQLRRFSYNQLVVLGCLLTSKREIVTVAEIEKMTQIKSKALGGVLSSLSRSHFRGEAVIEPVGRAKDARGLRWMVNDHAVNRKEARGEVAKLLASY